MAAYIIAEMGVNFYDTANVMGIDPIEAAKLYIDKASEAGINCAKFQSYKADTIASKNSPAYWDTTKETSLSQYELFKRYDHFNQKEYIELCNYAHSKGMDFISTPFDYNSADYLCDLVDFYKISSSDLSNIPFIEYIARKKKKIVLSVGASYLSEIDEAVRIIENQGVKDITLLHCMLSYPTKVEDANLNVIKYLKEVYPQYKIGYSDHVAPDRNMIILSTAYLYGAEVIEKHFTLDKTLKGNDHYHAGDPDDFKKIIDNINIIDKASGYYGKTVFDCEKVSRREARRSLVINRDMKKGDTISQSDLVAKRPGNGISPKYINEVIGRQLKEDVVEDTTLKWDLV